MKFEVFIVDDDQIVVFIHRNVILKSKFHADPLSFCNGKEALDYLLAHDEADKTCCVFLDINMPVMNGWEFLDALNGHTISARILVVMITSSIDAQDKEKAGTYPQVIQFIEKPISLAIMNELKSNDTLKSFFEQAR